MEIRPPSYMIISMKVTKRNGSLEELNFDQIANRLKMLSFGLNVDCPRVAMLTIANIYDKISTCKIDEISARISESFKIESLDYSTLATRLVLDNLYKSTSDKFSDHFKESSGMDPNYAKFVSENAMKLDNMINTSRDELFTYYGLYTLQCNYLYKTNGKVTDRPQYLFMRVAINVSENNLEQIEKTYELLSQHRYIHASPTLFNSCRLNGQMSSCFLLGTADSIEGILSNLTDSAMISKMAGGIGIHMNEIRAEGSIIKSTGGLASGLPRQLKIYNELAKTFDQGGKRPGAIAIYLEPWHQDIMSFLSMKLQHGEETRRARDLFYGLWICDLFVKRVLDDKYWSMFSPDIAPGLANLYDGVNICNLCNWSNNPDYNKELINNEHLKVALGERLPKRKCDKCVTYENIDAFTILYEYYEKTLPKNNIKSIKTRSLLDMICNAQRDNGSPYICFKDHVNRLSNQQSIGTIKSSNLCTEIMEWSNSESYASCTLASINLRKCVVNGEFSFKLLEDTTRHIVRCLTNILFTNNYPTYKCIKNAHNYRPIGIGIQGLASMLCDLGLPFLSTEAEYLDLKIAESMYYFALDESCNLVKKYGKYANFESSPLAHGMFHHELWNKYNTNTIKLHMDWDSLRKKVIDNGVCNSLLIANMPTVSTSQIFDNSESFEPFINLYYTKTTAYGKISKINTSLIKRLENEKLWSSDMLNKIINNGGSIENITEIPQKIRDLYKIVWDMKQSELMCRSALRSAFVDQSQSLNIYIKDNSDNILRNVFLLGHKLGLKTGSYYIRTLPSNQAMKNNTTTTIPNSCKLSADCVSCSS